MSSALVFVAAALGIPLDHLALVARGACIPGSHATVAIGEMVHDRLPPPGHCTGSALRHDPFPPWSFCEGGLFACPGALA